MARRRASMREGPLAELFRATEAAQRQAESAPGQEPPAADAAPPAEEPDERTVDHIPSWEETAEAVTQPTPPSPGPDPLPPVPAPDPQPPAPRPDPIPSPLPDPEPPAAHIRAVPPPPPVTHFIEPLPEQPARLHRAP